ncbi:hypothetical protein KCV06_g178, partial [Aureobasidium melanogenum]
MPYSHNLASTYFGRLIVSKTCASSFFMQQAGERRCDVEPGSDAAVRRRLSFGVTLQQTGLKWLFQRKICL